MTPSLIVEPAPIQVDDDDEVYHDSKAHTKRDMPNRKMRECLEDGDLVSHRITAKRYKKHNERVWEGKYNEEKDGIEHKGVIYTSPGAFMTAHRTAIEGLRNDGGNGWEQCKISIGDESLSLVDYHIKICKDKYSSLVTK